MHCRLNGHKKSNPKLTWAMSTWSLNRQSSHPLMAHTGQHIFIERKSYSFARIGSQRKSRKGSFWNGVYSIGSQRRIDSQREWWKKKPFSTWNSHQQAKYQPRTPTTRPTPFWPFRGGQIRYRYHKLFPYFFTTVLQEGKHQNLEQGRLADQRAERETYTFRSFRKRNFGQLCRWRGPPWIDLWPRSNCSFPQIYLPNLFC